MVLTKEHPLCPVRSLIVCVQIDVEEFIAWAKGNVVSMGLLTAFKSVAPDLLVDKRHLIALRHRSKPVVAETSLPQLSRKQRLQVGTRRPCCVVYVA